MGVVATVLAWNNEPHWYAFALLVLYPIAVWLGSRLRSGGAQPAMISQVGAGG